MTINPTTKYRPLAPKEHTYLLGRAHGLSNKEVAREQGVSHRTVEAAMARILFKLDARKITEAVFKATSEGLLCALLVLGVTTSSIVTHEPVSRPKPPARPTIRIGSYKHA